MKTQTPTPTMEFVRRFSATPKCAQLSRLLALNTLDTWGIAHGSGVSEAAAQIVAELSANAVTHAKLRGREFELRLTITAETLRIEISDALGERAPVPGTVAAPGPDAESGRGLLIVELLATAWGVSERVVGKTVWAELALPGGWSGGAGPR